MQYIQSIDDIMVWHLACGEYHRDALTILATISIILSGIFSYFLDLGGGTVAVCYKKLRYRLLDDKISLAKLSKMAGISDYAVRQINKDNDVSTEVLTKICTALNCEVQDIIDFLPERRNKDYYVRNQND